MTYDFKKHSNYVWRCTKCGGYWGGNQIDGGGDIECPACHTVYPATVEARKDIVTCEPVAILPEEFPMLYSAMMAINGDTGADRAPCLPASAFHGALAFLTLDALRAMDGDLARFYVQYGQEGWREFLTGEQGEVEARLAVLPFYEFHNEGIRRAHELLNQWFNGFEDEGKPREKSKFA